MPFNFPHKKIDMNVQLIGLQLEWYFNICVTLTEGVITEVLAPTKHTR